LSKDPLHGGWTTEDSLELYNLGLWSAGFFSVNEKGNVEVLPRRGDSPSIDLFELVKDLRSRGHGLPLLIRFSDILKERVLEIQACFRQAIEEYEYEGSYRGVYPIKVNQQAHIVEELMRCGRESHLGLEVGSKPELLVGLALLDDPEALIICNGYKDESYIETALLAQKLGRNPILVLDRFHELDIILDVARRRGIRPRIGVRAKLQAKGAGRWAESGGGRSKFGLTTREIMRTVERLREEERIDSLELLHFHIGSQITSIRSVKDALREASRIYVELHALGAQMKYLDVGGGLAVDYDGSNTNFHSSMNYSVQEYANDVVAAIGEACESRDVPAPVIVSESGRALVAHQSVLVFDVLDRNEIAVAGDPPEPPDEAHTVLHELYETWQGIRARNLLEPYHDAVHFRDEANQLFNLGYLDLEARAMAESLFFACCHRIQHLARRAERIPEELEGLDRALADTFYCNFSVFQSVPDSWAVGQLFPVMPIHRLEQEPVRRGIIADLTCDSDGKMDQFIDLHDVKHVLDLHPDNGNEYYLGVFLIGAYQEILGDLHNLFGDTNAIHVALDGDRYRVSEFVRGDTVSEVLDYVEFDKRDLLRRVQQTCEDGLFHNRISAEESASLLKHYEKGLNSYTYLAPRKTNGEKPA
jgi:arginine decarboxylase